jgi:hypothetical protein
MAKYNTVLGRRFYWIRKFIDLLVARSISRDCFLAYRVNRRGHRPHWKLYDLRRFVYS